MNGKRVDDKLLRKFWASAMTDKELSDRLGHHRGVVRRRAETIGLKPRRVARVEKLREAAE